MTSHLDIRSVGDRRRTRAYLLELGVGIAVYLVLLGLAIGLQDAVQPLWRAVLALLPAVPVAWIGIAVARHLRRVDEYQRLRTLEGLGVGFVVAMLAAVTIGLLDPFGFAVPASAWWIYSAGMLAWLVAAIVQRLR